MVIRLQLFVILAVEICFIEVADGECGLPEQNIDTEPYYKNCHKDYPLQYNSVTLLINGDKTDYPVNIDPPNWELAVATSGTLSGDETYKTVDDFQQNLKVSPVLLQRLAVPLGAGRGQRSVHVASGLSV